MRKSIQPRQLAPILFPGASPRSEASAAKAAFQRHRRTGLAKVTVPARPFLGVVAASILSLAITGCARLLHTQIHPASMLGDRAVVPVTGTIRESRPMLTSLAQDELRAAAESQNVTDSFGGNGSITVVSTADGQVHRLPLTPAAITAPSSGLRRTHPGLDLPKRRMLPGTVSSPALVNFNTFCEVR
jgi:hypothetical protein